MRSLVALAAATAALVLAGCGTDAANTGPGTPVHGLRVINAYTQPIDVLVDGAVSASAVPPGSIDSLAQDAGGHAVAFRATGTTPW